jgi:hypothetical protein
MTIQPKHQAQGNGLLIVGHLFCLTWLVFCCLYYLERTIYIDSASQIFEMVNSGTFSIFVSRYSMVLNELLPLAAIKLHMGLRVVVFLYAISFALIMYLAFVISAHYLKSLPAAFIIVLMPASLSHTFFHGISETVQLIVYASLLFAWVSHLARGGFAYPKWVVMAISLLLTAITFFIHPVSAFFIVFIFGFVYIDYKLYRHWYIYTMAGIFVVLLLSKLLGTSSTSHDASFFEELKNFREIIPGLWQSYTLSFFKVHFFNFYLIPSLALIAVWLRYLITRQWLKMAFVLSSIAAFLLISLIVYHKGDADHAMERTYLPLAFFCGLPFLHDVLLNANFNAIRSFRIPVLAVVAVWGFYNIASAGEKFHNRILELKGYLAQAEKREGSKFIVNAEDINLSSFEVRYFVATESLILSSLDGPENSKTIFINENLVEPDRLNEKSDLFLFTDYYLYRSDTELNPRYFKLSGYYKPLYGERLVAHVIHCGAEELSEDGLYLIGSDGTLFKLGARRDSSNAYSGSYSVATGPGAEFAMSVGLPPCEVTDQWRLSVKRKGNAEASLVVTDGAGLYLRAQYAAEVDSLGWEHLESSFIVTNNVDISALVVYLWNPSSEITYFDELKIVKLTQSGM